MLLHWPYFKVCGIQQKGRVYVKTAFKHISFVSIFSDKFESSLPSMGNPVEVDRLLTLHALICMYVDAMIYYNVYRWMQPSSDADAKL